MVIDVASLRVRISADTRGAQRNLEDLDRKIEGAGRSARGAQGNVRRFGDAIEDTGRDAERTSRRVAGMSSNMGNLAKGAVAGVGAFAGFAATNAIMSGVGQAVDFVGDSIINMNSRLEQAEIAFTTMLGSAEAADEFLRNLAEFAAQTPFEFPELVGASQRMLAMGFAAEEVFPLLTAVGDAAAAAGGNSEMIDRITRALGQMQARTKVSAEEMLQLTEAGIPAWQLLSEEIGVSVAELQDMVTSGEVASEVMIEAFQAWAAQNVGGMMQEQAKTFQGAMSTIQDSLTMAIAQGGRPFFEMISEGAVELSQFVQGDQFNDWIEGVAEDARDAALAIREFISDNREDFIQFGESVGTAAEGFGNLATSAGDAVLHLERLLELGTEGSDESFLARAASDIEEIGNQADRLGKIISGEGLTREEWEEFLGGPDLFNEFTVFWLDTFGQVTESATRDAESIRNAIEDLTGETILSLQHWELQHGISFANVEGVYQHFTGVSEATWENQQRLFADVQMQMNEVQGANIEMVGALRNSMAAVEDHSEALLREQNELHEVSDATGNAVLEMAELERQQFAAQAATDALTAAHNDLRAALDPVQGALDVYKGMIEDGIELTAEQQRHVVLLTIAKQNLQGQLDEVTISQGLMAAGLAEGAIPALAETTGWSGALFGGLSALTAQPWMVPVQVALGIDTPILDAAEQARQIGADFAAAFEDVVLGEFGAGATTGGGGGGGGAGGAVGDAIFDLVFRTGNQAIDAALEAILDQGADVSDVVSQLITGPFDQRDLVEDLQASIDAIEEEIAIADILGDEETVAELQEQRDAMLEVLDGLDTGILEFIETVGGHASDIDEAIGAIASASVEGIVQITEDGLAQLEETLATFPELAGQVVPDIITAVRKGEIPLERAMEILSAIPRDELLPILESLEEQFASDLVDAILETDQAAQIAAQRGLDFLDDVIDDLGLSTSAFVDVGSKMEGILGGIGDAASDTADEITKLNAASGNFQPIAVSTASALAPFSEDLEPVGGGIASFDDGGFTTGAGLAFLHPNEHITSEESIPMLADAIAEALRNNAGGNGGGNVTMPIYLFPGGPELNRIVYDAVSQQARQIQGSG